MDAWVVLLVNSSLVQCLAPGGRTSKLNVLIGFSLIFDDWSFSGFIGLSVQAGWI